VQQAALKWEEERTTLVAEANRKLGEAEQQRLAASRAAAEAEAKRIEDEAEQRRLATVKAEQERQAKAAAEAEAKRKADEAERQRLAAVKAEQERQARAAIDSQFSIIKDHAVKGQEYKWLTTQTIERCSAECTAETRCKMFSYLGSFCYLFDQNFSLRQNSQAQVGYRGARPPLSSDSGKSELNDRVLCGFALNSQKSGWDENPTYREHINEASRRSLTVDSCRGILGIGTEQAEQQRIANFDSQSLCRMALNSQKSGWDQNPSYATHVTEASRRGLTVDSCRRLVEAAGALPVTTASNSLFTIRKGMEAYGSSLVGTLSQTSIELCEQRCTQRSNCNAFTYDKSGTCYMYSRAELRSNSYFDSGVRN
jgi:PAN domain